MALDRRHGDDGVVAEHTAADHRQCLALRGTDFSRHDRGARLVLGQQQLADARARPRAEQAHVVGDLEQAGRERIERAVHRRIGVVRRQRLELVRRAHERQFRQLGDFRREQSRKSRVGIEPGADRRSALRERIELAQRMPEPLDARVHLGRITGKFLSEGQRSGVLQVGAADLDDAGECLGLFRQRRMQMRERRDQASRDLERRGDVHRGGEAIVRRLAQVDVIVGMDRLLRSQLAAEKLVRAVGDHLVGVHVGLGAGAGLPDREGKMIVELALAHFPGGPDDGAGAARVDEAELAIHLGGDALDEPERMNERLRHALAADPEILERALGLRAPVTVGRHFDRTERVGFGARLRHGQVLGRRLAAINRQRWPAWFEGRSSS